VKENEPKENAPGSRSASHFPVDRRRGRLSADSESPRAINRPPRGCAARDKGD